MKNKIAALRKYASDLKYLADSLNGNSYPRP